jgi:6-phosphogluconolactonase
MKRVRQISLLLVIAASSLILAACGQKSNCSGITFGGSTSGGGSSSGGLNSGGTTCGSGNSGNGNGSGGTVKDFLYYMEGETLKGASFSGSTLTTLPSFTSPALGTGTRADMTIVNKKFLYEPWIPSGGVIGIQSFSIDRSSGALSPIPGNPFSTTTDLGDSIAADPQGRFLFVGDSSTSQISAFQIDSTTGALTPAPGSPFPFIGGSVSILAVDGTGHYLYTANFHSNLGLVSGFSIDQNTGALTEITGSPWSQGLFYIQPETSGKFLLGLSLFTGSLVVVPIEAGTGALLLPVANLTPNSPPDNFAVHPSGSFVYTFAVDSKNKNLPVEGFVLDTNGGLTPMTGSPFSTLPGLHNGKFDQDGTGLFGLLDQGQIQVFTVDPATGSMTATVSPLATVSGPFAPTN